MRIEGHIYVYNGSGHKANVRVVGEDVVQVDYTPGHNSVIHFTLYDGGDLFPPLDAVVDIYVKNYDDGKVEKHGPRMRLLAPIGTLLLFNDGDGLGSKYYEGLQHEALELLDAIAGGKKIKTYRGKAIREGSGAKP